MPLLSILFRAAIPWLLRALIYGGAMIIGAIATFLGDLFWYKRKEKKWKERQEALKKARLE